MSTVDTMDPTTFAVPSGQALLYTEVIGNETLYKYKLQSGTTGAVTTAILAALGVKEANLPVLVYQADLLSCLNEAFASVADLTIATSTKASIDYVKKTAATKVNKSDYLTRMAQTPTFADLETSLSNKADSSDVNSALDGKADKNNTYSKDEVNTLVAETLAGQSAVADGTTIEGDGTADNPLTIAKAVTDRIEAVETAKHTHENISVLANFSEDANGNPLYKGNTIVGENSGEGNGGLIDAITVNGESVPVDENKVANITIDLSGYAAADHSHTFEQIEELPELSATVNGMIATVVGLEENSHTHTSEGNFVYADQLFACTQKVEAYKNFNAVSVVQNGYGADATETSIEDENIETLSFVVASDPAYYIVANDNAYLIRSSEKYFDNQLEKITGSISGFTCMASTSAVIAAIANGKLYVRAFVTNPGSPANLTAIPSGGNMLGEEKNLSYSDWTQVGNKTDWKFVSALSCGFVLIDNAGALYMSGINEQGILGEIAEVNDTFDFKTVVNVPTRMTIGGATHSDWIAAGIGRYYAMGMRGTVNEVGEKRGTIYCWGSTRAGALGNGIGYRQDFNANAPAWRNGDEVVYTQSTAYSVDTPVYTLGEGFKLIGGIEVGSASEITVGGKVYTRSTEDDINPSECYESTPVALAIPTRDTNGNVVSTQVVNDWFDMSAGWYHAGALRKNDKGETEIYLWGENEYGQLGNGNFVGATMTQSTLNEANAAKVEIVPYPRKLSASEFPFTDAVKIECNHYGTFIKRANGDVYFAGCNKRNFLGTGTLSDDTAFIPYFTKLGAEFNDGIYAMSYGALYTRKSPRLAENADIAAKAVLSGKLSPANIDKAVVNAHTHVIDTATIDRVTIMVNQYADKFRTAMAQAHSHANIAALNSLSVHNNVLKVNNVEVGVGTPSTSAGTIVAVDPSNVMLDTFCDIAGMSNIAGGVPLEVLAYNALESGGAVMWVAPLGNTNQLFDRFMDIETKNGDTYTTVIPADIQRKGLYAKPSNGTGVLVSCVADLKTAIDTVLKSSSATLNLYYLDPLNGTTYTNGSRPDSYGTISYATLKAGELYAKDGNTSQHIELSKVHSVGFGERQPEEKEFETVYDKLGNVLITEEEFKNNTYYLETGDQVTDLGMIVGVAGSEKIDDEVVYSYHTVYLGSDLTTVKITETNIKDGLYTKVGSSFVRVKESNTPEKFDKKSFEQSNGSIYVNPGKSSLIGVANQQYTFDTSTALYINDTSDTTKLKSVLIRLNEHLTNYDDSTSEPSYEPGSVHNPMSAAIYSQNRSYTSTVNGEFNAAIGYNAQAIGNLNNVFGDYSFASGIANTVTGSISCAFGDNNVVVGQSSYCLGASNVVAGVGNYVTGWSNKTHGYYAIVLGSMNETYGVDGFAIGSANKLIGSRATAIGTRNTIEEKATNSVALGNSLTIKAEKAVVIGQYGNVGRLEGNHPGEDIDSLYTITSTAYASAGYDAEGVANKNGLFICAGDANGANDVTDFVPAAYTKYLWQANNAFFGAATGSSNRSKYEPYIYKPYYQWKFTGVLSQSFVTSTPKETDATQFVTEKRDGGRVKSFDPGLVISDSTIGTPVVLDFRNATRWKFDDTNQTTYVCGANFVDGAEAYVVLYAGSEVYLDFDGEMQGVLSDDATQFSMQTFVNMVGGDISSAMDLAGYVQAATRGFALVKLMVVDDVMCLQLIANTLA